VKDLIETMRMGVADIEIFPVNVSNGTLGISQMPGRNGRLADDLSAIKDWRPALVISMTTGAELAVAGRADMGGLIQAMGIDWSHFPVADYATPTAQQAPDWHALSGRALAVLKNGGRVLIHCKGGCGRSGIAVLRLMVEAGERPSEALGRLRAVRPCAVETDAQFAWAAGAANIAGSELRRNKAT